jgi:2-polyprenyl-3-methyl-5-hydroxy-6-metoxy-1,4-benzoquinol methylase
MFVNTKQRSTQSEAMDDLAMEGEMLRDTLGQLARINYWLGGYRPTISALKKMIQTLPLDRQITIVDIGCGGGDMLRVVAAFGRKYHRNFKLIGIDANDFIVNYAKEQTIKYPEISYFSLNVFSDVFAALN